MLTTTIHAKDLPEVEEVVKELLPHRTGRIEDGRINGVQWFQALLEEAKLVSRRRRIARRAA